MIWGNNFIDSRATPTFDNIIVNGGYNIISGNQINRGRYGISLPGGGNANGCVISNNTITSTYTCGILLQAGRPSLIIGNMINLCGHGGGCSGISCNSEHYIIGNSVVDCNANGIYLTGASGSIVKDNWVYEEINAGTMTRCILCDGGANNNFITDNTLQDSATIMSGMGAATVVKNNIGYVTENEGVTGAVADAGTFAHGLSNTPTGCVVTGTVTGDIIKVTGLGAANVTVSIKDEGGGAGTAQVLYFRAWV